MNLARRWTSPSSATVRWLLGVVPWIVAVTVVLVVLERGDRHAEIELLTGGPFATATIVAGEDDEPQARYTHQVVGDVVAGVDAGGVDEGDQLAVAYDVDDPYRVAPRDHEPRRDLTPWIVAGAVLVTAGSCGGGAVVCPPPATTGSGRVDGVQHAGDDPPQPALDRAAAVAVRARTRTPASGRCARSGWPTSGSTGPRTRASRSTSRASRGRPVWSWCAATTPCSGRADAPWSPPAIAALGA